MTRRHIVSVKSSLVFTYDDRDTAGILVGLYTLYHRTCQSSLQYIIRNSKPRKYIIRMDQ